MEMITGMKATAVYLDELGESQRRISTFSRESKIFRETFHYANPIMYSYAELAQMRDWCWKTFGAPGHDIDTMKTTWDFSADPDVIFWFGEEKNLMLFILRWS
jgi:hypothetical protein